MSRLNKYNFFSTFSYLLLLIKFPVLLIFDNSSDNLSSYFIVISFSIATNFITSDLLSYKKMDNGLNMNEIVLAVVFFFTSSILIFYNYPNLFVVFVSFNFSLFLNSISISRLREIKILYIIYLEILVSLFQLGASLIVSNYFEFNLGYSLIISTSFIYLLVFLVLYFFNFINFYNIKIQNQRKILSINLYFDMLITQYERFLLSIYLSNTLAYINIVSSIVTGLKRIVFDDNEMHKAIVGKSFNYNKIAIKYSVSLFCVNFILIWLYQIKFLESSFFLNFIRTIKPSFVFVDVKYIYVVASLYFGVNPISFFVSHHFRNGSFKIVNFLVYLPILIFSIFFLFDFVKINQIFLFVLMSFTTMHFILFFSFLSRRFYRLNRMSFLFIIINYLFGYFCSFYYSN